MKLFDMVATRIAAVLLLLLITGGQYSANAQAIAAGFSRSLFLKNDGTVWACGNNAQGVLGDGTAINQTRAVEVLGLTGITAISSSSNHSLFIKNDGTVWAMGNNGNGQLGDGTTSTRTTAVQVSGLTGIIAAEAGIGYSLFLKNDGTVWACGNNAAGQLGDGTTTQRNTAVQVIGLTGITAIAAGSQHALFLKNDGTVWGCGDNFYGQLVDGTTTSHTTVVQASDLAGIGAISAGSGYSLFLKSDGRVLACGYNLNGQLGDGTTIDRNSGVVQVSGLAGITAISAGSNHSLFLKNDGTAWACGFNHVGALGDGTMMNRSTAVQVLGLSGIAAIKAGGEHSLFLKNDGTVWACGNSNAGQLGNGSTTVRNTAAQVVGVDNLYGFIATATGYDHSLFLKKDGTVWASGRNELGQLGDSSTTDRAFLVQVKGLTGITAIAAGGDHSLFLKNDSTVWACGYNSDRQLGDGSSTSYRTKVVQVSGITGIVAIAAGSYHSVFLKKDGTAWACGRGPLGTGGGSQPVKQVLGITGITAIVCGSEHTLFLKSDRRVWGVGANSFGQLGYSSSSSSFSSVIQLPGMTDITAIAAGGYHSLFRRSAGTVMACGKNDNGQLGDGSTTQRESPVAVTGLTNITALAAGLQHSLFLKNDDTVWACGNNTYGQHGNGTSANRTTPVQISSLTGIASFSAGEYHSLFLKDDSMVRSFGLNTYGELGDGMATATGVATRPRYNMDTLDLGAVPPAVWYSKATGNLDSLATWGANTDGSGASPTTFVALGVTYNIVNNPTPTIGGPWAPPGTINLGDGSAAVNFTIPAGFAYSGDAINVLAGATLTISNTTLPTLGTLAAGSTVVYSAAGAQNVIATAYGNLGINNAAGATLAGNIITNGVLNIGGPVALGSNTLYINGTVTGMSATNHFVANGSSEIEINGTGAVGAIYFDQTTNGTTNKLNRLALTRSSGSLTLGSNAVLNLLTLNMGKLNPGANTLVLNTVSAPVPDAATHIVAASTSDIRRMTAGGGASLLFPIGDGNNYTPITLSVAGTGDASSYVAATVTAAKHPDDTSAANYLNRYWSIASSGITSPAITVTNATFVPADVNGMQSRVQTATYASGAWTTYNMASGNALTTGGAVTEASFALGGIAAMIPVVTIGNNTICTGETRTLTPVVSGGGTPYTYEWYGQSGALGTAAGQVVAPATTTVYTVVVTGANLLSTQATATVTVNTRAAIVGGSALLFGQTTTLSNEVSGGTWSSSAPWTAQITPVTGIAKAIAAGTAEITYTTAAGCISTHTLSVLPGLNACVGQSITISDGSSGGTWTSSSAGIATVGPTTGVVTAVAPGKTVIKHFTVASGVITSTVTVNPLTAITSPAAAVCQGQSLILTNTTAGGGTWYSSNTTIATINASGMLSGNTAGAATVYFTPVGGCVTTKGISVSAVGTITGNTMVCIGQTTALSNSMSGGNWSTSSGALATISATGVVGGVAAGTPRISYIWPSTGCVSVAPMMVNALSPTTGATATVCRNQSITLTNPTGAGTWTSSNTAIAVVSGGIVTGTGAGSATISFNANNGCVSGKTVTVNAAPTIGGISSVCTGQTTLLSNSIGGGAWSSSNAMATVNAAGVVGGVSAGAPRISYIMAGTGCYATATVTVNALSPITGGTMGMCASAGMTLANTTPFGGVWSSSNSSAATVNPSTGFVKGTGTGTTVVSFTTNVAGCVATRSVTVNACRQSGETTSIDGLTEELGDIQLFPNPNNGSFTLRGAIDVYGGDVVIQVVDMLGQVVFSGSVTVYDGRLEKQITLPGNLAAGTYMLTLSSANERKVYHFVIGR